MKDWLKAFLVVAFAASVMGGSILLYLAAREKESPSNVLDGVTYVCDYEDGSSYPATVIKGEVYC
jgi:hypothetical protein